MMFRSGLVAVAIALAPFVDARGMSVDPPPSVRDAVVPQWGQCGGIGYTGSTTCASGTVCTVMNPYYSQCLAGTASSTSVSSTTAKTTTTSAKPTTTTTSTAPAATGFVTVSGQKFMLNGKTFPLVGENSYWVGLNGYSVDNMNKAFADIAATGATAVRTWGFNEVTSANGIYYQLWSNGKATVNTGSTGLQNFDNVVAAAKANGIRLIVALTNNWQDYGGMDVYVSQITGTQSHDLFYTDANVQAAYKSYVNTFVTRYKNEPTILAWELANEPRCKGSTGTSTGTCTTSTITNWISTMSAYIKSIDSNHLVAVGDEGFFNEPSNPSYPYQGSEGIDFDANLKVSTIDFGTAHLYPEAWGQTSDPVGWGSQWIKDHQTSGAAANKPVIMEEFGVTSNQSSTYTTWYSTIVSSGLTGDLIWQAGSHLSVGDTPDDGFTIYPDDPVYPIITSHAAAIKARG